MILVPLRSSKPIKTAAIIIGIRVNKDHQESFGNDNAKERWLTRLFLTAQMINVAILGLQIAINQIGKPVEDSGVCALGAVNINVKEINDIIIVINMKLCIGWW